MSLDLRLAAFTIQGTAGSTRTVAITATEGYDLDDLSAWVGGTLVNGVDDFTGADEAPIVVAGESATLTLVMPLSSTYLRLKSSTLAATVGVLEVSKEGTDAADTTLTVIVGPALELTLDIVAIPDAEAIPFDPTDLINVDADEVQGAIAELDAFAAQVAQDLADAEFDLVGGTGIGVELTAPGVLTVAARRQHVMSLYIAVTDTQVSILPAPITIDPDGLTDIVLPVLVSGDTVAFTFYVGDAAWTVTPEPGDSCIQVLGLTTVQFGETTLVTCAALGDTTGDQIPLAPTVAPATTLDILAHVPEGTDATVSVVGLTVTAAEIAP